MKKTILKVTAANGFDIEAEDVMMHQNEFEDRMIIRPVEGINEFICAAETEIALKEIEEEFGRELECEITTIKIA